MKLVGWGWMGKKKQKGTHTHPNDPDGVWLKVVVHVPGLHHHHHHQHLLFTSSHFSQLVFFFLFVSIPSFASYWWILSVLSLCMIIENLIFLMLPSFTISVSGKKAGGGGNGNQWKEGRGENLRADGKGKDRGKGNENTEGKHEMDGWEMRGNTWAIKVEKKQVEIES